jgi:HK97 gp10 family phage protein
MSQFTGHSFRVTGTQALYNVLKEFPIKVQGTILDNAVSAGATVLKKAVKQKIKARGLYKSGNLYNSISKRKVRGVHGAYEVYTDGRGSHAHLLEFGTGPRKLSHPRPFKINGEWVTITHTGSGPIRAFFRPAIDENMSRIYNKVMLQMAKAMAKHAAKLAGKYGAMSKSYRRRIAM